MPASTWSRDANAAESEHGFPSGGGSVARNPVRHDLVSASRSHQIFCIA